MTHSGTMDHCGLWNTIGLRINALHKKLPQGGINWMMTLVEVMVNNMMNRDLVRNCDEDLDAVLLTDLDAVFADNDVRYVNFLLSYALSA